MATTSAAARRQLHRVDDPDGFVMLVRIDNPALSGPVRIASDTRDWTIGGETYVGIPLVIDMPQDVAKEAARARIVVDNVGRDLLAELEAFPPGTALQVELRLISRAAPSVVEWEFVVSASSATADAATITMTLSDDELAGRLAVALRYDPDTAPGIHAG